MEVTKIHQNNSSTAMPSEVYRTVGDNDLQTAIPAVGSGVAGQRRLRTETGAASVSFLVMTEKPAADLQAVYERFKNAPKKYREAPYENNIVSYFAEIGDIHAISVLIRYGKIINSPPPPHMGPIQYAAHASKYEMVRFLADHGAIMYPTPWGHYAWERKRPVRNKPQSLTDVSNEKLRTLEYLLDRGTPVNGHIQYGSLLANALSIDPLDEQEKHYKDKVIKMLLDRGAKLSP